VLNSLRHVTAVLGLLSIAACAPLGPDFQEPEQAWLQDWQPQLYGESPASSATGPVTLDAWWAQFSDPTLSELMRVARSENPSLRITGLRILESRALAGIATGLSYPQVQTVSGNAAWVNQHRAGGDTRDLSSGELAFNLGWELDFWGRFRRGIESADAAYFASIAAQRDAQVLLTAQLATLYFNYKTTLQRIEIAERNVALQERSYQITERRFERGQDSELDLQQAKSQYLSTLATIPGLQLALTQTRNALGALLGRAPGNVPELSAVNSQLPVLEPSALTAIPAQLLLRRPDVRAAAWQAAAQSAQVGIAQADLYPAISLFGVLSWSDNSLNILGETTQLAMGPRVSWNLFNYGRIENSVRVQDARLQQALERFRGTALNAAREMDDAASRIARTRDTQDILDQSLVAAERSLTIATRRYQEGYSSFQRVLDAQAVTFAQSDRAVINRGQHVTAVIDLYRALGGGWTAADNATLLPAALRETMRERTDWGELLDAPLPQEPDNTP
tara:strand:+ start:1085 stop:2605 length:1521 start_codon:yes stop_codon:yes gene_type:complete